MADYLHSFSKSVGYTGLPRIFEFVNHDGRLSKWNCGQAAAATLLTHHHVVDPAVDGCDLLLEIERQFPPDILGGWFGSSRRRVTSICRSRGLPLKPVRGEAAVRAELERGNPVVVMLGVSGGKFLRWDLPGGHWMVAYGFDDNAVYLTNWGKPMLWEEFRIRWRAWTATFIQMDEIGLVSKDKKASD